MVSRSTAILSYFQQKLDRTRSALAALIEQRVGKFQNANSAHSRPNASPNEHNTNTERSAVGRDFDRSASRAQLRTVVPQIAHLHVVGHFPGQIAYEVTERTGLFGPKCIPPQSSMQPSPLGRVEESQRGKHLRLGARPFVHDGRRGARLSAGCVKDSFARSSFKTFS
jgi:hypothetical protein